MPPLTLLFRRSLFPLCLLAGALVAHASLWETNDWALTGTMNGSIGYDSNLTESHTGPEDFFAAANPVLTLARRDSSTDFRIIGGLTHTEFLNNRQPKQTDLNFDAVYAYPNADNVIPIYRAEATWQKSSQPNEFLGARIQTKQLTFNTEGYLPLTGKLGLRGTAAYDNEDYNSILLNQSQRGEAFVGLAFQRTKQTEFSVNLGTAIGHSQPNDPKRTTDDVRSKEYYITLRVRGELTAKVSGSVYGGFGRVDYTGGYINRNNLPVGGADLTWTIDPHRTLALSAASVVSYAPDGETGNLTNASLTFTHEIVDQWQYGIHFGPTHSVYSRKVRERTDDSWAVGTEFAYQPSLRFRVALALNYTNQSSDKTFAQFTRDVISLGAAYRF